MTENETWLEERRKGLGGSDAAPVLGLSPWKTPYQVWLEKRGEAPEQEDNEPMFWGRTLEPVIRQRYADVTGRSVAIPKGILVHPKHKWMLANLDGIAGDRVLEVKTARSAEKWGEPGSDEIPEHYRPQVEHYMAVTGLLVADVAVLIGGQDFRIYEVPADKELQELIIEQEAAFWEMVEKGTPPEVTNYADVKARFGKMSRAVTVEADRMTVAAVEKLRELKDLAKQEEILKAHIMKHLGEADTLVDDAGNVLCTWKLSKPTKRLDTKALQAEMVEVYQKFLKEGDPSRRFLIK